MFYLNTKDYIYYILHYYMYESCLKSFRPQHKNGGTCQQKFGNVFAHAFKGTHQIFSHF